MNQSTHPDQPAALDDTDYRLLSEFRHALRAFLHFSEEEAAAKGLTPQQHQALLAVRGAGAPMTVGELAERLMLRPHSATGLVDRLVQAEMILRVADEGDRRRVALALTSRGENALHALSAAHQAEIRRIKPLLTDLLSRL
jgi:DNA-binding MarR family transcriptional regulator